MTDKVFKNKDVFICCNLKVVCTHSCTPVHVCEPVFIFSHHCRSKTTQNSVLQTKSLLHLSQTLTRHTENNREFPLSVPKAK